MASQLNGRVRIGGRGYGNDLERSREMSRDSYLKSASRGVRAQTNLFRRQEAREYIIVYSLLRTIACDSIPPHASRFRRILLSSALMKKVLIVAYYFPPSGGPGVQRVLKYVQYLREFGWEPVVLT